MPVLKVGQINPDGVPITIPWDDIEPEKTFFVPCINTLECSKQLQREARKRKMKLECRIRIEEYFGIRAWRVK